MPERHQFSVLGYTVQMSEEIVRWCFEIQNKRRPHRTVAFTNPTAGPWKLVKMENELELYRFGRDEERPDVIVVCDDHARIYVIEAKETVGDVKQATVDKTFQIASRFAAHFLTVEHPDWAHRLKYTVVTGFIFGSTKSDAASDFARLGTMLPRKSGEVYLCAVVPSDNETDLLEQGTAPPLFQ